MKPVTLKMPAMPTAPWGECLCGFAAKADAKALCWLWLHQLAA